MIGNHPFVKHDFDFVRIAFDSMPEKLPETNGLPAEPLEPFDFEVKGSDVRSAEDA